MHGSVLIKTWVGALVPQKASANGFYENAGQPRGGGWGSVRNIVFSNFQVEGADAGPTIDQDRLAVGERVEGADSECQLLQGASVLQYQFRQCHTDDG
jgi:hypothetical protein